MGNQWLRADNTNRSIWVNHPTVSLPFPSTDGFCSYVFCTSGNTLVMGFRLNLKLGFSVHSPFFTNSSPWPSSYSFKGWVALYDPARASFPSVISHDSEILYNDLLKAHTCSSASQTVSNDYLEMEEIKVPSGDDKLPFLTNLLASKASHFSLLMENLVMLEETFADSDVVGLERDILVQLERLGALNFFHKCLSRTQNSPTLFDLSGVPTVLIEEPQMNDTLDNNTNMDTIVVRSRKKGERKSRRQRASKKDTNICTLTFPSKVNHKDPKQLNFSSVRRYSKSRSRRIKVNRNEAELARGVKVVANLERIRKILEEQSGKVASFNSWAEAAGVDKKILQEQLHFGWCCRDELLRSARSLVIYLARNYRGLGVAHEDIIQAGNIGVLQGAERFDHTRGYKFSTYVHYWIKKSMSTLITQHARGIRIPLTLSKAINQIQKARKIIANSHGKCPDDDEIAKFTGLSLAKITSASKCSRVVGSIDQKVGDFISAKFLELTPDTSMEIPEETVMRQNRIKDIYDLLNGLDPRERQVLALRLGLGDHQCKSLEEIGRLFNVSKEWIRKIERTALTKLRDEETLSNLSHYMYQ